MKDKIHIIIDTNVIVSSLLNAEGSCGKVLSLVEDRIVVPVICEELMQEYIEVLHRKKFGFSEKHIYNLILTIRAFALTCKCSNEKITYTFADEDDEIFYRLMMESKRKYISYLVTGNKKHYPNEKNVLSPSEFIKIAYFDINFA